MCMFRIWVGRGALFFRRSLINMISSTVVTVSPTTNLDSQNTFSFASRKLLRFPQHIRCSFSTKSKFLTTKPPKIPLIRHPWSEWLAFVDSLKNNGYFPPSFVFGPSVSLGTTLNALKDACFNFSRHRSDIFLLLSVEDIKHLVERGCPNLRRKAVNSSKRLRLNLGLTEADVCRRCKMRSFCKRAYILGNQSGITSPMTDIVRLLFFFALDSSVRLQEPPYPSSPSTVEASARHLLSQMVHFSSLPKPTPPSI